MYCTLWPKHPKQCFRPSCDIAQYILRLLLPALLYSALRPRMPPVGCVQLHPCNGAVASLQWCSCIPAMVQLHACNGAVACLQWCSCMHAMVLHLDAVDLAKDSEVHPLFRAAASHRRPATL